MAASRDSTNHFALSYSMFAQPSAAALNHLLTQNRWALPRLARFAGKTARFDIAPFSFSYTILADGSLRRADASSDADALCVIARHCCRVSPCPTKMRTP